MHDKIDDTITNHYIIGIVGAWFKCSCGKHLDNVPSIENHLKLWNKYDN